MKPVEIYTTQTCPYCIAAKRLLVKKGVDFKEIDVGGQPQLRAAMICMRWITRASLIRCWPKPCAQGWCS